MVKWVIVPAAGVGSRMGADIPKQYLPLAGKPVLEHTLQQLLNLPSIEKLVVAISPDDDWWPNLVVANHTLVEVVEGGSERCSSVLNALHYLKGHADALDWVLVHDAARPCVLTATIERLCEALKTHTVGGILGVPVSDTLKQVDQNGDIQTTLDRRTLWYAQTPQMFRYGLLKQALDTCMRTQAITDEASALEMMGYRPGIIEGRRDNIKITRPEDVAMAEAILAQQLSHNNRLPL